LSLKNDIDMVKDELSSEEKFFEKAVVTEKFVKKYKNAIIGLVVVIVVGVAANIIYTMKEESRISEANTHLAQLMQNGENSEAAQKLATLSPALYDAWRYSQAVVAKDVKVLQELEKSPVLVVNDLASYELAQNSSKSEALDAYASKEGSIYSDLAKVQSAVILLQDAKTKQAREKLSSIREESPLYKVARTLMHYGVK
jgi:hypothetical protein